MIKLFKKSHDGGPDSGVTGYWLVESKKLGSVVLLHFRPGSREAFHNHAFNALTWWLKGNVVEHFLDEDKKSKVWYPSFIPKITRREDFHKIYARKSSWALSIRGPWKETWNEFKNDTMTTLTFGRKVVSTCSHNIPEHVRLAMKRHYEEKRNA